VAFYLRTAHTKLTVITTDQSRQDMFENVTKSL